MIIFALHLAYMVVREHTYEPSLGVVFAWRAGDREPREVHADSSRSCRPKRRVSIPLDCHPIRR
jgi:hypothetical protein